MTQSKCKGSMEAIKSNTILKSVISHSETLFKSNSHYLELFPSPLVFVSIGGNLDKSKPGKDENISVSTQSST